MNIREQFLPYALPYWDEGEIGETLDTIRSNWWSRGPKTAEFERQFAEYVGAKYAIALNSCTAGLHLALVSKGIGVGDEVITPSFTFCSTVNTIVHTGATPVFVDIRPDTYCIDENKIEEAITEKTRAIIPVHYAGQACDMDKIMNISKKYNLFVLEDAAHAVYTKYKDKMVGSIGDATAFSFYATKNLSTGEGGMLTTNDEEFAKKARLLSLHGMSGDAWKRYSDVGKWRYDVPVAGYKYNMTDIAAGLGLVQLNRLEYMQDIRNKYADLYNKQLSGIDGITLPIDAGLGRHAWHLYVIWIDQSKFNISREAFINEINSFNIGTSVHFVPVHMHSFYNENYPIKAGTLPITEKAFEGIISLPLYPSMKIDDVEYVAKAVREIAGKYKNCE